MSLSLPSPSRYLCAVSSLTNSIPLLSIFLFILGLSIYAYSIYKAVFSTLPHVRLLPHWVPFMLAWHFVSKHTKIHHHRATNTLEIDREHQIVKVIMSTLSMPMHLISYQNASHHKTNFCWDSFLCWSVVIFVGCCYHSSGVFAIHINSYIKLPDYHVSSVQDWFGFADKY